jgi:hypothetical protein
MILNFGNTSSLHKWQWIGTFANLTASLLACGWTLYQWGMPVAIHAVAVLISLLGCVGLMALGSALVAGVLGTQIGRQTGPRIPNTQRPSLLRNRTWRVSK